MILFFKRRRLGKRRICLSSMLFLVYRGPWHIDADRVCNVVLYSIVLWYIILYYITPFAVH